MTATGRRASSQCGTIIPAGRLDFFCLDPELRLPLGDTETLSPTQLESRLISCGRDSRLHTSLTSPSFSCSHLPQGLFVFIMSSPPERTKTHLTTISSSHFLFSLLLWPLVSNFILILFYFPSLCLWFKSIMKKMLSGYISQLITSVGRRFWSTRVQICVQVSEQMPLRRSSTPSTAHRFMCVRPWGRKPEWYQGDTAERMRVTAAQSGVICESSAKSLIKHISCTSVPPASSLCLCPSSSQSVSSGTESDPQYQVVMLNLHLCLSLSCLLTCLWVTCYTQCLDLLDRDEKHSSHIKHIQSSDTRLFLHVRKRRDLKTCIWTEGCERASKSDLTEMKCGISNPQVPTECDYSWDNWALWLFSFLWSDRQKIWVLYSSLLVAETETSWSWRLLGTETESSTTQCSLSVRVCLYSTCFSISSISAPSVGPHLSLPQSFSTCSPSVMELAALISSCCILLEADVFTVVWGPDQSLCLSLSLSTVTCVSVRAAEDFSLVSVLLLVALGDFRKSQMKGFIFMTGICVLQLELSSSAVLLQYWDIIVKTLLGYTVSTVWVIVYKTKGCNYKSWNDCFG